MKFLKIDKTFLSRPRPRLLFLSLRCQDLGLEECIIGRLCRCVYCTGAESESETETESHQLNKSLVWVVVLLLSFGVSMTLVAMAFCWCCYWQRRRPLTWCDRDVTSGTAAGRDLLQSLVAPPLIRKRILFMRDNILYASGTVPKVRQSAGNVSFFIYQFTQEV